AKTASSSTQSARVPQEFLDLARQAASASDTARWQVLYDVLWRLTHGDRDLLKDPRDPSVRRLRARVTQRAAEPASDGDGAAPSVPSGASLRELSAAAARCTGCDLYRHATQTVFGRGSASARVVFVGEQPGDQEDRQGAPFVGPAGAMLDKALDAAGIPRHEVYVTNAVKHFKWEPRGKRRIHKKPRVSEIKACRPWLEAELRAVKPQVVVCLGATAAQSMLGAQFKLMQNRGKVIEVPGPQGPGLHVVATIHPSAILRAPDA